MPDGPAKELDLPASATQTVLTELIPDVEYVVTIISYDESEESLPVFGQLTSKYSAEIHHWNDYKCTTQLFSRTHSQMALHNRYGMYCFSFVMINCMQLLYPPQ